MADPDPQLLARIRAAIAEEHALRARHGAAGGLTEGERARMAELEVHLDQLWDLLRQRRAKREAGADPDDAAARPVEVVENYQG